MGKSTWRGSRSRSERGQVTPLLALVMAALVGVAIVVAMIGQALVDRRRAVVAADSVALAAVIDAGAADELARWYGDYGIDVAHDDRGASARSGHAQARAWAMAERTSAMDSPAIAARMARAEQLVGRDLLTVRSFDLTVVVSETAAAHLRTVARELGLCERFADEIEGEVTFEVC